MKKILSIDGGGIRGIIPAVILCEIEEKTGKRIAEIFDLMAGTSTGGIIVLGLNVPDSDYKPLHTARHVMELYTTRGVDIFRKTLWRKIRSLAGYFDVEYSNDLLQKLLNHYLKDLKLDSSITKTIITSYDIENRRPYTFKSWEKLHKNVKMKDVAMATTAAPSYFEPVRVEVGGIVYSLIDGGVFNNNPALTTYLEATRIFQEEDTFLLLSLGTGENAKAINYQEAKGWGKVEWIFPVLDVIYDGMNDEIDYHLNNILGNYYFRLQCSFHNEDYKMEVAYRSSFQIESLINQAKSIIKSRQYEFDNLCSILSR